MHWYIALSGSIITILLGIYKGLNIGLTMVFGATVLGLLAGLPAVDFFIVLRNGLLNEITIMLVISILLLGVLGHILKATGAMEKVITSLYALVADVRIIASALPMLIGMLTVPGGAILSAPLCAEAGHNIKAPPAMLAAVNIWFRHVLYFMFPLFPSLILAAKLSGVSLGSFFLHNLPLTITGTAFGFYFLFRGYRNGSSGVKVKTKFSGKNVLVLLQSIMSLLLVLVLVVFFDAYFPYALAAGIALALLNYLPGNNRLHAINERLKTMIVPGIKLPMALVIAGIMLYKEMLTHTEVLADLTVLVLATGMPVIILVAVIPFFIGLLTGDNSASVAITFPLFMPLLPSGNPTYAAYLAFLYAGSTAGHIISPAHPCFALTKEYYNAGIREIFALTLPLLAVIIATGFLITLFFGLY